MTQVKRRILMQNVSVDLIIGGQWGDEGKGCMSEWLSKQHHYDVAVRTGGPNAGHTGTIREFHCLPVACTNVDIVVLPACALIDLDVLASEVAWLADANPAAKVWVSPYAAVVEERGSASPYGSIGVGVGKTRIRYMQRLAKRVCDVMDDDRLKGVVVGGYSYSGDRVLIESSQGYGLSLHSARYPYITTADLNPYAILGDSGVPYGADVTVWAVFRFYPVRVPNPVGGSSGDLPGEIDLRTQQELGIAEYETFGEIVNRAKRMAHFNIDLFREFMARCRPNRICFTHGDKFQGDINEFQERLGCKIDFISESPANFHLISEEE